MRALLNFMWSGLLASSLLLPACAAGNNTGSDYTLYLVRHAEKVIVENHDPNLTAEGTVRATKLATRLQNKDIKDIWSSDYKRTLETAAPLAEALDIKVRIYNPREQDQLVTQLSQRHNNALIVGHSNTIPELAGLLCNCEVAEMDETEYDRLIVIRVKNGKAKLQTLRQ